ncbi:MAG: imidazole glycerol phosphate synthase subunit HisH [Oscillospiraceae bacterium]|nr:imidazole glycerol phosphate synthase subunit HisH [Oscillospiraceae bacterium]
MVSIVEYGVGNLFSLKSSFAAIGEEVRITGDKDELLSSERIILPGVGAFGDAADSLRANGLDRVLLKAADKGIPIMGICLGMQLLFDFSEEYGHHKGLGLIPGGVKPISDVIPPELKIPHIGWNALSFGEKKHPIFKNIREGDFVYFVHSYYGADCSESTIALTEYGAPITAAVARGNVCGCQFHPEKSGEVGLNILRAFCAWDGR